MATFSPPETSSLYYLSGMTGDVIFESQDRVELRLHESSAVISTNRENVTVP